MYGDTAVFVTQPIRVERLVDCINSPPASKEAGYMNGSNRQLDQSRPRLLIHAMPVTLIGIPPQQPFSVIAITINWIVHFTQEVVK